MQDGYTQSGAGDSDMRQGGCDLQHARQKTKSMDSYNSGGPMKMVLGEEMKQHQLGRDQRLQDLQQAYSR